MIGTTDTEWTLDPDHPAVSRADVDYLLGQVNTVLRDPITHDDIVSSFAGLRPLVDHTGLSASQLSREHLVRRPLPGLVTVTGGKYTTYRVMAADAVDAAATDLVGRRWLAASERHRGAPTRRCGDGERGSARGPEAPRRRVGRGATPCSGLPTGTGCSQAMCSTSSPRTRRSALPCGWRLATCARRRSTPRRTKAPSPSTTCSRDARGPPSKPWIEVRRPRPRSPISSATPWDGARCVGRRRSRSLPPTSGRRAACPRGTRRHLRRPGAQGSPRSQTQPHARSGSVGFNDRSDSGHSRGIRLDHLPHLFQRGGAGRSILQRVRSSRRAWRVR